MIGLVYYVTLYPSLKKMIDETNANRSIIKSATKAQGLEVPKTHNYPNSVINIASYSYGASIDQELSSASDSNLHPWFLSFCFVKDACIDRLQSYYRDPSLVSLRTEGQKGKIFIHFSRTYTIQFFVVYMKFT
jgi:hypothetical protein